MKLTYQQLSGHLKNNLLPVYLISGNEPLLVQEARDAIRQSAKKQGYFDLKKFDVNKDFDWQTLIDSGNSLSLFSDKSFIEIKLNNKPNVAASKQFTHYLERIDSNSIVVVISEKLDANTQKASWVTTINKVGTIVAIWPLDKSQFKQFIEQRLLENNLQGDQSVVDFLFEHTEGNLLALAQEVEKLKLLFDSGSITLKQITNAITENARYDIYLFIDIILQGEAEKTIRVLQKLKEEGIEPTLLLWAITREIRSLINIISEIEHKTPWDFIVKKYQIWDKRQPLIKKALKIHSGKSLYELLLDAGKIDLTIKGLRLGNFWDEFELLALRLGGLKFLRNEKDQ